MNATGFMSSLKLNCFPNTLSRQHLKDDTQEKLYDIDESIIKTKNIKHFSTTSSFRIVFLRILILVLSMSSFSYVSPTTSAYSNIKYGMNTIKTKYGLLRGIVVRTSPLVEAYLGIPYASPPIGSLRFMPPITPSSWKNVRNADRFAPVCPQTVPMPPNGPEALLEVPRARLVQFRRLLPLLGNQSEDCLYLNVYTPKKSLSMKNSNQFSNGFNSVVHCSVSISNCKHFGSEAPLPDITTDEYIKLIYYKLQHNTTSDTLSNQAPLGVGTLSTILFIHGESFEWNSGNPYDGSELAAQGNVIVVTINFRLGILGFLKTGGKESAQGNFGLMDLVAGLHWLKENLPAFGGDSNSITIMGHGTGAALANILLVSPVSSDLIQRAILISGSALSPWAIQKSPLFVKRRVAEQTGCHGDLLYDDLAPCLRTKSLSELLAVKIDNPRFLTGFAPFVDGTVIAPGTGAIGALKLPLGSAIVSTSGIEFANFPKQDLLFGLTSVESYLDLNAQDLEFGMNETRRDRILRTYVRNVFHYHLNEIFAVLKNEYTDWEKAIRNPFSSRDAILSFLSDGHTASHLIKIGYMHNLRGGRSYFLHFKHKTEEEEYPSRTGSVRGEDVPFWLGLPVSPLFPQNYSIQERRLSSIMVKYLSNFVKTGNPNLSSSLQKDNRTQENSPHSASENFDRKRSFSNNITDNNSEADFYALPKRKRRVTQTLIESRSNQNSFEYDIKAMRQKRSNMQQIGLFKFKRNVNKDYQFRNLNTHSFGRRKHVNFGEVLNDGTDKEMGVIADIPYWETYDCVNQLYLELGSKAEIHSHYRGHKLSMWLNLIPQLHKHANFNEMSIKHHQFLEDSVQFYDGIVRAYLQIMPKDDVDEVAITKQKVKDVEKSIKMESNNFSKPDVTTDCNVNTTQIPYVIPPTSFVNNTNNTSDSIPNVLENLDVLRRLSSKQLQSYTTALVATIAVGSFLLVLNILIFAAIYHQRERRARDTKKKEQLEENELFMHVTTTKSILSTNCAQSTSGKVSYGEYNCFEQKQGQLIDKDLQSNASDKIGSNENVWACSTNAVDLLNVECSNENLSGNACSSLQAHNTNFKANKEEYSLGCAAQSVEMPYQNLNNCLHSTNEEVLEHNIPEPPPPPKSVQLNQGGILRISGTNPMNPANKKRVHIQEISV